MPRIFPDLPCAKAGCKERAKFVVIQTDELALLFKSMAGVACNKHAKEFSNLGGAPVAFEDIGNIKKRKMP